MAEAPVLLVMARAGPVRDALARRSPAETFLVADTPEALAGALAARAPEIAYSVKDTDLDPAVHAMLRDAATLKWVHVGGSGYDHMLGPDGAPWDAARLTVTNCAGVLAPFLADTCMGAILAFNQRLLAYAGAQRARQWRPLRFRPLAGQRLLVVGAGAIGTALAGRARAFGLEVAGIRRDAARRPPEFDEMHAPGALDAELARADIVSVHLRLGAETRGLFDRRAFAAMKPGALFLNTGRGGLVVEADLIAALESGQVGAAYLDVFEQEPLPAESPLWTTQNLLLSPHVSDQVEDWEMRFAALFADNLARWRTGAPLFNVVTP